MDPVIEEEKTSNVGKEKGKRGEGRYLPIPVVEHAPHSLRLFLPHNKSGFSAFNSPNSVFES